MIKNTLKTQTNKVPIFIGDNIISKQLLKSLIKSKNVVIITNNIVAKYHLMSLKKKLNNLLDIFPQQISGVRGKGLMLGLKCVSHNVDLVDRCRKEKLLLVPGGSNTLRILPPLIITYKEIEEGIERLQRALIQMRK